MIDTVREFTEGLPPLLQWLGVALGGAIPFVESYLGSAIGVVAGLNPVVAVAAAVAGNVVSMLAFVLTADRIRQRRGVQDPATMTPKRQRVMRMLDRFGVPGVSLLGQTLLPSQISSAALVAAGARTRAVIGWQVVSIILWGVGFALLARAGVNLVGA